MIPKLSQYAISKIKISHNYQQLNESLIDELIPDKELRERYKRYGLCEVCDQPKTDVFWCQYCNSTRFQRDFIRWTSGNKEIDDFIQKSQINATRREEILEWIPYNRIKNIKYLAKRGGFGAMYKAEWIDGCIWDWDTVNMNKWKRYSNKAIVLKYLNNSQNLTTKFLQEITFHKKLVNSRIVKCYGISQDPLTKNFIMVMESIENCSISQFLKINDNRIGLRDKLIMFSDIANVLKEIHDKGFIHKNLHSGNILIDNSYKCHVSDLGLYKPVDEENEKIIYGVLPYVAPEVLRGKIYTRAADIYSFGILAYEIFSELPPFHHLPHDESFASKICQGIRPKFNIKIPSLLKELIDRCLDANPLKRPTADELYNAFNGWKKAYYIHSKNKDTEFYKQCKEAEEFNKSTSYKIHKQAIYYSRPLDYKNLPEPRNQ